MTDLKPGHSIHKVGGRYGGPGRIVGVTDELDADGYRLYSVAMAVADGYGEFVHVFPASALSDTPDPRAVPSASDLREESGLAKALRWIVQNPLAHPMNMHRIALDALKEAKLAPSDMLLAIQTEGK